MALVDGGRVTVTMVAVSRSAGGADAEATGRTEDVADCPAATSDDRPIRWCPSWIARGAAELAAGRARRVLTTDCRRVSAPSTRPCRIGAVLLAGDAAQRCGEWREAQRYWRLLVPAAGPVMPDVCWRLGSLLYLQGDHEAASEILGRAELVSLDGAPAGDASGDAAGGELADAACVHAWSAALAWRGGRATRLPPASAAVELAGLVDAGGALAAAYGDGDGGRRRRRRDANLRYDALALEEAEACGDLQQIARIRCNRGCT